jgi:hypothetical protein
MVILHDSEPGGSHRTIEAHAEDPPNTANSATFAQQIALEIAISKDVTTFAAFAETRG